MTHSVRRTALAGMMGGIVFSLLTMPTFGILGTSGGHRTGLLFNPDTQSAKLIPHFQTNHGSHTKPTHPRVCGHLRKQGGYRGIDCTGAFAI